MESCRATIGDLLTVGFKNLATWFDGVALSLERITILESFGVLEHLLGYIATILAALGVVGIWRMTRSRSPNTR